MNSNQCNKFLTIAAALAMFVTTSAHGKITYDFDDGKMHGWHNVKVSTKAAGFYDLSFGLVRNDSYTQGQRSTYYLGETGYNYETPMNWANWPDPGSGVHQTLWVRSPAFKLDGVGALTFWGYGTAGPTNPATGLPNLSLVGFDIPDVAGTWGIESGRERSTSGIMAIGLRDDVTGEFVLSKNFIDFKFALFVFAPQELAPLAKTGHAYTLDMVDALAGINAWCAIDRISIPGTLVVPEPYSFNWSISAYGVGWIALGAGVAFLIYRKFKKPIY